MNNQNNFYDPSFMLGALLNVVGLDKFTLNQIIDRRIIISKKSEEIKTFILSNASYPETFLQKMHNLEINFSLFNEIWENTFCIPNRGNCSQPFNTQDFSYLDVGNLIYYKENFILNINQYKFSIKQGKALRQRMIFLIDSKQNKKFKASQLATLFDVSKSTIDSDRKAIKKNESNL